MDTTQILLLGGIILLILLAVGVFVATLTYWQRGQAKKSAADNPPPAPEAEIPSQGQAPPSLTEAPASPGEVMRVIRDEGTGRVLVEVEGQRYAHIREIQDPQAGRRVLWAIADLIRFTGGMAANPKAMRGVVQTEEAARPPEPTPVPEPDFVSTVRAQMLSPSEPSFPVDIQPPPPSTGRAPQAPPAFSSIQEDAQTQPQRYNIGAFFRRAFEPVKEAEPLPGPSAFVDQIEEILQEKIRTRAIPLPYDVHVQAADDGALLIQVGQSVYSSPEEVPQAEIKELIRAAVAEWETR